MAIKPAARSGISPCRVGNLPVLTALGLVLCIPTAVNAAPSGRAIEEVIVTAERQEASVQDTSISITAFTSEMLDDFGIRNQSDLQNMVPATTIQPYDAAIRGVGRNFRNLGGDPGIATYMNGVYSEDLYTATIGSFWDLDRIEVLRGPQGTLYGRNAVGGAMNFLYKRPSDEFEFAAKAIVGDYGTNDVYGMVSGPLIEDVLSGRLTASSRRHDGWVEERSGLGPDLDSGDEQNVAVQFEWHINDNMNVHLRSNRASVDRVFGGANGGGLIMLRGENSAPGGDGLRNYTRDNHDVRNVDPTVTDPTNSLFVDPTQPVLTYTNPKTGAPILAQYTRPGIDPSTSRLNHGKGLTISTSECLFLDRDSIKGDDLCAFTNGRNNETFNQQGNQLEFTWELSDGLSFKYILGYNQLLYERDTDDDNTGSLTRDNTFFVNHEAEYISNEFQLFWDVGEDLTFTSGIFFYTAQIDQRYDFYDATGSDRYTDPAQGLDSILAAVAPGLIPGNPPLAFLFGSGGNAVTPESVKQLAIANSVPFFGIQSQAGAWLGDATLGSVNHGPVTVGTDLIAENKTHRDAFAAYTQGVWDINDRFTLTAGLRYAKDEIEASEDYSQYTESMAVLDAFGINLALANILRGALNPATLQPTGVVPLWYGGTPITFGLYRKLKREDTKVTWRVNLDYNITDDTLIYGNVTTGYRGGGFNVTFFSQTPEFEPEELIAYELGYKTQLLDNTLQLNASVYLYDYDSIHTATEEACPPGGTIQSAQSACAVVNSTTSIQAAPGAEVSGLEFEVLWLATDNWTFGGNFSYTDTEYSEDFFVVDGADPTTPGDLYDVNTNPDRRRNIKGRKLLQVPDTKASAYAAYNFPLGDNGTVELLASWSYIDDVYFSAFESKLDLAPAYDRLDVRATWTSADDTWVVSGFVNNVTDDIGIRQILRHGSADGYRRSAQVTEPRVYGLELSYTMR